MVVTGCQSVPEAPSAVRRPAVLTLENLASCAWRIQATAGNGPGRKVTVPVGETVRFELPAGTYEVEQEALTDPAGGEAVRRFTLPVEAGETYHWRLVTLAAVRRELLP